MGKEENNIQITKWQFSNSVNEGNSCISTTTKVIWLETTGWNNLNFTFKKTEED